MRSVSGLVRRGKRVYIYHFVFIILFLQKIDVKEDFWIAELQKFNCIGTMNWSCTLKGSG